jgi:hypothetical protein
MAKLFTSNGENKFAVASHLYFFFNNGIKKIVIFPKEKYFK